MPVEERRTAGYGAAVGVVVVVDGGVVEDLAVDDEVDATGVVVAHVDGEVLDASFVGAAGAASGPVVGSGAGAGVDTAVRRGEDRLGIETAYVAVGWKVAFAVEGKGSDAAAAVDVAVVTAVLVLEQVASVAVAAAANAAEAVVAVEEPAEVGWTHMEKYTSQEWSAQRQLGDSHEAHLG